MIRIGIISDTHGRLPGSVFDVFEGVRAIVHCGDVGASQVLDELELIAPVFAVCGNMDHDLDYRRAPLTRVETIGDATVAATHGHLTRAPANRLDELAALFADREPDMICYGHSHRYAEDRVDGVLLLNPGAVFHPRGPGGASVAVVEFDGARPARVFRKAV